MAPRARKREPVNRISVQVEIPTSMTFLAGEPSIRKRRGQRIITWTRGRRFRTVEGTPLEALTALLTLDFESNQEVLKFAQRWGPFVCHRASDEQWNADELFEGLAWRLGIREATLRASGPRWGESPHDDISLESIHQRVRALERSLAAQSAYDWTEETGEVSRTRSGPAAVSTSDRYGGARVSLWSETKDRQPDPGAFDAHAVTSPHRRFLTFRPRGGYGSLEYAAIGLILLALEHRDLRRCARCGRVYEPRTKHPSAKYCSDDCKRLARNQRRGKPT